MCNFQFISQLNHAGSCAVKPDSPSIKVKINLINNNVKMKISVKDIYLIKIPQCRKAEYSINRLKILIQYYGTAS